jgi:hypothetical protein
LETISIGGRHCFFANGENHKYLKYLILLIAGGSTMGGKIAEFGAEGACVIVTDIQQLFARTTIGGILCFFANGENCTYLKYLILLISWSSRMGGKIAKCGSKGA